MIEGSLELFRSVRDDTLKLVDGMDQAQAEVRPSKDEWSVTEILDHLFLTEKLYREKFSELILLQKTGKEARLSSSFKEINTSVMFIPQPLLPFFELPLRFMNPFVPDFIREMMFRNRLIPAQAPSAATPRPGRHLAEEKAELAKSIAETMALFHHHPGMKYDKMTYYHPLLGSNTVPHMVRIMAMHEKRHQQQIREVKGSVAFRQHKAATT